MFRLFLENILRGSSIDFSFLKVFQYRSINMITDSQANALCLADTLPEKYFEFYRRFEKILMELHVEYALLPNKKDFLVVDYIPIQLIINNFIKFTAILSICRKKIKKTIYDVNAVCESIRIKAFKSDVVVDGRSVVNSTDKVIMIEKVFIDNPFYEIRVFVKNLVDNLYFIPK